MKIVIEIGIGEFIDRLTILQIKKEHGLGVEAEIGALAENESNIDDIGLDHFKTLLYVVNSRLWILEGMKRDFEHFNDKNYLKVSELITHLNDLRYLVKKAADQYFGSKVTEKKSYTFFISKD